MDWVLKPNGASLKLSFDYSQNPIDKAAYKAIERKKNPNNAIYWAVATQPYEHLHLMTGVNLNLLDGPIGRHLIGLAGGIYTRFPIVIGMAVMINNGRFEKKKA